MKKVHSTNKSIEHEYFIQFSYEAGIILAGSEVKSIKGNHCQIKDAFVRVINNEAFIFDVNVALLDTTVSYQKHEERATRKLLLHKNQILKIKKAIDQDGYTCVPSEVYSIDGKIKVEIAVVQGKKLYDKRQTLKDKDLKRESDREIKGRF